MAFKLLLLILSTPAFFLLFLLYIKKKKIIHPKQSSSQLVMWCAAVFADVHLTVLCWAGQPCHLLMHLDCTQAYFSLVISLWAVRFVRDSRLWGQGCLGLCEDHRLRFSKAVIETQFFSNEEHFPTLAFPKFTWNALLKWPGRTLVLSDPGPDLCGSISQPRVRITLRLV